jgi:ABC-type Fe3+-hydroxamate transport system substrate-binding protein
MREEIIKLLDQYRLKEALSQMTGYATHTSDWQLKNELEALQTSYDLMLQYTSKGMKDPNKVEIYHKMLRTAYELADRIHIAVQATQNYGAYYDTMRTFVQSPPHSYAELQMQLEAYTEDMATAPLIYTTEAKINEEMDAMRKRHETAVDELFEKIWVSTRRMQNKEWLARLKDGRVKKIGMEGNFDTEIIIASQPDIIFVSPNRRGGYEVMKELNIPLVPYWAFKETSPLGLSEWIKVAGMFIGKEEEACQLFAQMEQRYNLLKAKVSNVKQRPSVFSGEMRRDTWYVPGGQSFYARLFADAGADYFMKDNPETGGVLMDFETVYAKGYNAGYWRVMNGYKGEFSYEALKASNPQYADFRAFKEKKVIYCNLEWIPLYENLPLSPDVLLSDMIKAFHPELLPDYHPVFYSLLEKE